MKIVVSQQLEASVKDAVAHAIKVVGWNGFLATSIFPSSRHKRRGNKLAA